jgi:hypothetical protein
MKLQQLTRKWKRRFLANKSLADADADADVTLTTEIRQFNRMPHASHSSVSDCLHQHAWH